MVAGNSLKVKFRLFLIYMVNGYMSVKNQNGKFIDKFPEEKWIFG